MKNLIEALISEDEAARTKALRHIRRARLARPAIRELIKVLEAPVAKAGDIERQFRAAEAAGRLGKEAAAMIPALLAYGSDPDGLNPDAPIVVMDTVGDMISMAKGGLALKLALREMPKYERSQPWYWACMLLPILRQPAAKPAVPYLLRKLSAARDNETRVDLIKTLGGVASREAVPHLVKALRSRNRKVLIAALEAIKDSEEAGRAAIPALLKLKDSTSRDIRGRALIALGSVGYSGWDAYRLFVKTCFVNRDTWVSGSTGYALGLMVGRNRRMLDDLLGKVERSGSLRSLIALAKILRWSGKGAKPALPFLNRMAWRHKDSTAYKPVMWALNCIELALKPRKSPVRGLGGRVMCVLRKRL